MYNQRDIIIIPFPFTNLQSSKPRPAVIISNQIVNKTSDVIVAQITSNLHSDEFSFVISGKDITEALIYESEVRCHKIFTIAKSLISKKVSELNEMTFQKLPDKIRSYLN